MKASVINLVLDIHQRYDLQIDTSNSGIQYNGVDIYVNAYDKSKDLVATRMVFCGEYVGCSVLYRRGSEMHYDVSFESKTYAEFSSLYERAFDDISKGKTTQDMLRGL